MRLEFQRTLQRRADSLLSMHRSLRSRQDDQGDEDGNNAALPPISNALIPGRIQSITFRADRRSCLVSVKRDGHYAMAVSYQPQPASPIEMIRHVAVPAGSNTVVIPNLDPARSYTFWIGNATDGTRWTSLGSKSHQGEQRSCLSSNFVSSLCGRPHRRRSLRRRHPLGHVRVGRPAGADWRRPVRRRSRTDCEPAAPPRSGLSFRSQRRRFSGVGVCAAPAHQHGRGTSTRSRAADTF